MSRISALDESSFPGATIAADQSRCMGFIEDCLMTLRTSNLVLTAYGTASGALKFFEKFSMSIWPCGVYAVNQQPRCRSVEMTTDRSLPGPIL